MVARVPPPDVSVMVADDAATRTLVLLAVIPTPAEMEEVLKSRLYCEEKEP